MARKNLDSLFDDVQDSLNDSGVGNQTFKDFMKLERDKEYIVRLVPNRVEPKKTFYHYKYHGWKSFATGNYVQFLCPSMVGDPSPINTESWSIDKSGDDELKEKGKALWRKDAWLVNVYVISDPTNPDNEGQVKILKMGKQLYKKVDDAMKDKEQFGMRIFDLGPNGCNFKIKVDWNGRYNEYNQSSFRFPSEISGIGDDEEKIEEVEKQIHDLQDIYNFKSYKELKQALDYHFYGIAPDDSENTDENEKQEAKETPVETDSPKKEEPKKEEPKKETPKPKKEEPKKEEVDDDDDNNSLIDDDEINNMLEELDD